MPYSIHRSRRSCAERRGFTLIELLIVIGIITVLIVLGLSVAGKVSGTGKAHVTRDTLKALDTTLDTYIQSTGSMPPAWVLDPRTATSATKVIQPVADARSATNVTWPGTPTQTQEIINSVGLFMLQCKDVPAADQAIKGLDPKMVKGYSPEPSEVAGTDHQTTLPTAMDGWGNPIRYVHPAFKGLIYGTYPSPAPGSTTVFVPTATVLGAAPAGMTFGILQIRRNNDAGGGDSDGGINTSARPYFYSCGPDGDPTTIDDNIYLTIPRTQKAN